MECYLEESEQQGSELLSAALFTFFFQGGGEKERGEPLRLEEGPGSDSSPTESYHYTYAAGMEPANILFINVCFLKMTAN